MSDQVAIAVTLLPTIFAAIRAAMGSEELDRASFVDPALRPIESSRDESCGSCPEDRIRPFVQISIRRTTLSCFLGLISLALLSAIPFLILWSMTTGIVTPALSFLVYFLAPFLLQFYYVIGRRDVFYWWRIWWARFALVFASGTLTTVALTSPEYVDLLGYLANPTRSYNLAGNVLPGYIVILLAIFPAVIFLIVRYWVSRHYPSLRRRILIDLDANPDGFNVDGWMARLNPSNLPHPSREEIRSHLEEAVYQGFADVVQRAPGQIFYVKRGKQGRSQNGKSRT